MSLFHEDTQVIDNEAAEDVLLMINRIKASIPPILRGKVEAFNAGRRLANQTAHHSKVAEISPLSNEECNWIITLIYDSSDSKRIIKLVESETNVLQGHCLACSTLAQIFLAYQLASQIKFIRPLVPMRCHKPAFSSKLYKARLNSSN